MKRKVLFLLLLISATVCQAQGLDAKFVAFRDFCFATREAFAHHSADSLAECVIVLDSMHHNSEDAWTVWDRLLPVNAPDTVDYDGHLLIDVEWMDSLVYAWSESSVAIDVSTRIRGRGLMYANYLIPANSTQAFTAKGRGRMTLVVISEDGSDISLAIDHPSCDFHYVSRAPADKGCQFAVWQAPSAPAPFTPYEVRVTNPSDHAVVCVFATD